MNSRLSTSCTVLGIGKAATSKSRGCSIYLRQGDKETRRATMSPCLLVSLSAKSGIYNDQVTLKRRQALGALGRDHHIVLDPHAAYAFDIHAWFDREGRPRRERLQAAGDN